MEIALFLGFCVWIAVVIATRMTRAWWVARLFPALLGILSLAQVGDTHGDIGGMQALANAVATLAGLILLGLSAITFVPRLVRGRRGAPASGSAPASGYRYPSPVPPAIPPAYVVTRSAPPSDE